MKLRLSFYYVGNLEKAVRQYSKLLGASPIYTDQNWARFHLDGGDLALHLDESLPETSQIDLIRYGAVVSLSVENVKNALQLAKACEFVQVGGVEDLSYGILAQIRDPWGNRLSMVEPKGE